MQESDLRNFVLNGADAKWGYPEGRDISSHFASGYVCISDEGINFWREGNLKLRIGHDAETRARYEFLLQRQPSCTR